MGKLELVESLRGFPPPHPQLTRARDELKRCLLERKLSFAKLQQMLEKAEAPSEKKEFLPREVILQLQRYRLIVYFLGAMEFFFGLYSPGFGLFSQKDYWILPLSLFLLNSAAYFLLKRVSWYPKLLTFLFFIDIVATEYIIWLFSVLGSYSILFLPILVIAMAFYLPKREALLLSLFLILLHDGLLFSQSMSWIPEGPIGVRLGLSVNPLKNGAVLWTLIYFSSGVLGGTLLFSLRIFGLLKEREIELEHATELIRRYIPTQVADSILSGELLQKTSHLRQKITIFFSDIQGFTEVADQMEPEEFCCRLEEYRSTMTEVAERYGGTIDKFVGDAMVIFFGAPQPMEPAQQAKQAVWMALEMQARMEGLKKKWFEEGVQAPFDIRIGINTGVATVGSFGSDGRLEYTAIGNQVNLAARLQTHAPAGSILCSHATWALIRDEIPCVERGAVTVKGLHYPVKIYEVLQENALAAAAGRKT